MNNEYRPSLRFLCGICHTFLALGLGWLLSATGLSADMVEPVGDTGYRITVPDGYRVFKPANAPKIHLQADAPDGQVTIQVVQEPLNPTGVLASNYEQVMRQALGEMTFVGEGNLEIAGTSSLARRYTSGHGAQQTRILAAFYSGKEAAFVIHAIFRGTMGDELIPYLASLEAPVGAAVGPAGPSSAVAGTGGPVSLPGSEFRVTVPRGWQSTTNTEARTLVVKADDEAVGFEFAWAPNEAAGVALDELAGLTIEEVKTNTGLAPLKELSQTSAWEGGRFRKTVEFDVANGSDLGLMVAVAADPAMLVVGYGYIASEASRKQSGEARTILASLSGPAVTAPAGSNGPATAPVTTTQPADGPGSIARTSPDGASGAAMQPRFRYQGMVVEDAYFEFEYPAHFSLADKAEGQTQWSDTSASAPKVVLVIQTMARTAGNTLQSVVDGLIGQVKATSAARLLESTPGTVGGMAAHQLHFTLDQGSHVSHFRYIVLDLKGPAVATVSYVGPASQLEEVDAHYQKALATIAPYGSPPVAQAARPALPNIDILNRAGSMPASGADGNTAGSGEDPAPNGRNQAGTATPPRSSGPDVTPSGGAGSARSGSIAASSREAWLRMNEAARNKDWVALMDTLEPEACQKFLINQAEERCRDAGVDPARFTGGPLERLLAMLQTVPSVEGAVSHLGRTGEIFNIREENDSMHLVMVKFGPAGQSESWFWMRRINGRWMHTPN